MRRMFWIFVFGTGVFVGYGSFAASVAHHAHHAHLAKRAHHSGPAPCAPAPSRTME